MKQSMWIKSRLVLLFGIFAIGSGSACAAEKLVLQLSWHHQFQFAGYYMAKEQGYYQDAGLDVEIRDVTNGENPVDEVLSGRADFGISGSGLLVERSLGKPVVAVAPIFQHSPTVFLTLQKSGIRQAADLIGKKVMLSPGYQSLSLLALLHQEKLLDQVQCINTSFDYNSLLNGETDVFNAYRTNEPYLLEAQGYQTNLINPADYGIDFYADILFSVESFLQQNPKTVEKFRKASLMGWHYALSHPDETIALIKSQYHVNKTIQQLQFEAAAIKQVIQADLVDIGNIDRSRWAQIAYHLKAIGQIPASFHWSNDFLYNPPPSFNWKQFRPWLIGLLIAFAILITFLSIISRSNIRLRATRKHLRQEIQERKLAEDERSQLLQAIDQSSETIVITDIKGAIQYINPAFEKITGYTYTEAIGQNPRILKSDHQDQAFYRKMWATLVKGDVWKGQFINKNKNGALYIEDATISPVQDTLGKVVNYIAVKRDITHEVEMEEQLRQKYKMEAVGLMAGGIAHNFNNNLAIILGNVELSQIKLPANSDVADHLKNAKIAILRSRDLVQQILTYSREGVHQKTTLQLPVVVDETIKLLHSTIPVSVNLQQVISINSYHISINGDSSQIQEILINLCNNAVHAMNEKGELTVSLETVELQSQDIPAQYQCAAGSYVKLSVQDDGAGMPPEILDKVFDPFFTTKEVNEGTGMGLATVQGIVNQHNGLIKVHSTLGQGSTFELYFPISEQFQTLEPAPISGELPQGTERILFLDDDEMLSQLGDMMLSEMGYQVTAMTSSIETLKLFTANPNQFDLLITDQTMPELCGKDLIQKVLEIRPDLQTILCTGFSNKIDANEAHKQGISAFCIKPLNLPELTQTVRRVLDQAIKDTN